MTNSLSNCKWWQKAVFYQIYPRSFADGNGDGIGDLAGIRSKLGYLKDLGVDALWLSPHYPSPMCDCGYDVSDYADVAPEYGTLDEFKQFLDEAHQLDIRVILDLVLNHTSDQHAWFQESRSSLQNPKRDWYIWKKGKDEEPPNNWSSTFGGSAWQVDPVTREYYYHYFFKGQPDLNWHNPEVKEVMFNVVRFWLAMGVDGFRLDAVGTIFEDERWLNHNVPFSVDDLYPLSKAAKTKKEQHNVHRLWMKMFKQQVDQPAVHDLMKELRRVVNEFEDRVLVGESDDLKFYGTGDDELHLVFNFSLMLTDRITPAWVRANQKKRLGALPNNAWPCNTLGNHDSSRMISKFGDGVNNLHLAEINLAMMLFLKGTPFLYNGEEIGMTDYLLDDVRLFRDPLSTNIYLQETQMLKTTEKEASALAARHGRDICRTPMQWSNAPNAGFCPPEITPWLPVNPNYSQGINVAKQEQALDSLLIAYKRLLAIRSLNPALVVGDYLPLLPDSRAVLAFFRTSVEQECLVLINYTSKIQKIRMTEFSRMKKCIFSNKNNPNNFPIDGYTRLEPYEIWIGELYQE